MRYKVNDDIFTDYHDAVDACINDDYHWDDDYFEEWVNETWGSININGCDYDAYTILDNAGDLDDVRESYCDNENDSDRDNACFELRNADPGDCVDCQMYTIEVLADEEESGEDTDGDESFDVVMTAALNTEKIEQVRRFISEQQSLHDEASKIEKEQEDNIMKMFQVIT